MSGGTCAKCDPGVEHPDVDYCPRCAQAFRGPPDTVDAYATIESTIADVDLGAVGAVEGLRRIARRACAASGLEIVGEVDE